MNFYGLCLRAILVAIAAAVLLYAWRPIRVFPAWNWKDWLHLLIIGLPIFVVGELTQFWTTLEGTLVFDILGRRIWDSTPWSSSPARPWRCCPWPFRKSSIRGWRNNMAAAMSSARFCGWRSKPMLLTFAGMVPLVCLGWWLAGPLTQVLLPKYVGAVPAMQWALLPPLLSSLFPIHNVFNVVRRQDLDVIATLIGMLGYFYGLTFLFKDGATVSDFPQAMLIGRGIHLTACYLLLIPLVLRHEDRSCRLAAAMNQQPAKAGAPPTPADNSKVEPLWEVSHTAGNPSSAEEWNQAVENSADACLYHRTEIAPLFLEPTAHKLIFVECRLDGRLVGGAILVVTRYRWHRWFERRTIRASLGPLSVPPFVVDGLNAKTAEAVFDRRGRRVCRLAEDLRSDFLVLFDTPISHRVMVERPDPEPLLHVRRTGRTW